MGAGHARGFFVNHATTYSYAEEWETGFKVIIEARKNPDPSRSAAKRISLFNIWTDPLEEMDLAATFPDTVHSMLTVAINPGKVRYDPYGDGVRLLTPQDRQKLTALGYLNQ